MSTLNPIIIDRYVLYLDNMVTIRIDVNDPRFYECIYSNNTKLHLLRSHEAQLTEMLPPSFLKYDEQWINDNFIYFMNSTWDEASNQQVLITKLRSMIDQKEIREYGDIATINHLIAIRVEASANAFQNTPAEIDSTVSNTVQQSVAPIVEKQVAETVAPIIAQTVSTVITEQINVSGLDDFFNTHLNSEG